MKKYILPLSQGVLSIVMSVSFSQKAFAWGDMGHQIVGAIAEDTLSAKGRAYVRGILGVEPMYMAATWPDHARDDKRFGGNEAKNPDDHDFSSYHFCEIPTGFTYVTRPNKEEKNCHGVLTQGTDILKDNSGKYSHEEKIIALRYLIHVMGDVHQPLHVGNGFDRGANACEIKWQKNGKGSKQGMNFHSFWDGTMITYMGDLMKDPATGKTPKYISEFMPALKSRFSTWFTDDAKKKYGSGSVDDWLMESQKLRDSNFYPDDAAGMQAVPKGQEYKFRPYCLWYSDQDKKILGEGSAVDKTKIPVLTAASYADRFTTGENPVLQTQLLKAGLRLAATIDAIAEQSSGPFVTDDMQSAILKGVEDVFKNK